MSSMDEAVRVRNWPITVNYSSYIRLWLVNFLLFQPHPLLLLLIVNHNRFSVLVNFEMQPQYKYFKYKCFIYFQQNFYNWLISELKPHTS